MRYTKTLAAAAAIAFAGTTASAGGLGDVIVVTPPPAETGSINSGYIVLGLIAALVAASGSF